MHLDTHSRNLKLPFRSISLRQCDLSRFHCLFSSASTVTDAAILVSVDKVVLLYGLGQSSIWVPGAVC